MGNGTAYSFVCDATAGIPAVIEEASPTATAYYIREPDGSLVARMAGSNLWYYHFDALGSTRLITNGSGTVTDKYAYDAYGALLAHDRTANSIDQPHQYVGQLGYYTHYQEPEFGLLQLGVRFYDAEVGRFTQMDPLGLDGGLNQFAYVEGDPISAVDPLGEKGVWRDRAKERERLCKEQCDAEFERAERRYTVCKNTAIAAATALCAMRLSKKLKHLIPACVAVAYQTADLSYWHLVGKAIIAREECKRACEPPVYQLPRPRRGR